MQKGIFIPSDFNTKIKERKGVSDFQFNSKYNINLNFYLFKDFHYIVSHLSNKIIILR